MSNTEQNLPAKAPSALLMGVFYGSLMSLAFIGFDLLRGEFTWIAMIRNLAIWALTGAVFGIVMKAWFTHKLNKAPDRDHEQPARSDTPPDA